MATKKKRKKKNSADADVRVRMYGRALGDCFLLTFPRAGKPFHMLVDCGTFHGTENEKQRMVDIANDIADTTGRLDVVVMTHEHYDHLIGFKHARDVFEKRLTIGEVWMGWPDQPGHEQAGWLRRIESRLRRGLQLALTEAEKKPEWAERRTGLRSLLEFDGDVLSADYSRQLGEIKRWLREDLKARVRYLEPHREPFALGDVPDARVYVLGPPLDPAMLRKMDDSKSHRETYASFAFSAVPAFLTLDGRECPEEVSLQIPFEPSYCIPERSARADARTRDFLIRRYGFDDDDGLAWRRIDDDWMTAAEELALQLNNLTNNSSVALAIEFGQARRVILLAADAQVGNWLSWHEETWKLRSNGHTEQVTARELLARTVLYKVGHHGSHNATLKQKGLELMTSEDLVAMIPVDERFATDVKGWQMPFGPLLKDLKRRTRGRVIRADRQLPPAQDVDAGVRAAFTRRTSRTDLFCELRIPVV